MKRAGSVLRICLYGILGLLGLFLLVRGGWVVCYFAERYGFTTLGLNGLLGGLCLISGAILLVFPYMGGDYRERIAQFLACLTLYSWAAGPAKGAVLEWFYVASLAGLLMVGLCIADMLEATLKK
jgi:hypothetical protein